ncbi:MAG: helix-hairpin-helix domain-containing protein [Tannerella sp.]|jgi:competence ComEA-like helix-hairpin-helix protein|nr:helix-hairpin-helix domain-containing protein [Tannerella sp.]
MEWRDFFYFSKGERQALVVLLVLIIITGMILILRQPPASTPEEEVTSPVASESPAPDTSAQAVSTLPEKPSARQQVEPRTTTKRRESISERTQRMTSLNRPQRTEKFKPGTTLEINAADTTTLKKIPGIGSAFASRIVKYRNLLGGFHSVTQLREVYGIDEDKYAALSPWFTVETSHVRKLPVNSLPMDSLRKHPYISYRQARAIERLRRQKKQLSGWENLQLLDEFTENDKLRILPYLSFE